MKFKGLIQIATATLCVFVCAGCDWLDLAKEEQSKLVEERGTMTERKIEIARSCFDYFSLTLRNSNGNNFRVKVAIMVKDEDPEIVWIAKVKQKDRGVFAGKLESPSKLLNKQAGTKLVITRRQVVDWSFTRNGHQYGAFTEVATSDYKPKQKFD